MTATPASTTQPELLGAARRGGEDAFRRLADEHRAELLAHCYRMLGSIHDAEDALQETLLRAWRGLPCFAGRSSLRTWLHRIASNVCVDAIARRPRRVLPVDHGPSSDPGVEIGRPLVESVWVEPFPDETLALAEGYAAPDARYEQRESVELAFVAALQYLPATQRAVLLLREVLGFSAREVAETLDTTVASVNSALQRARSTVRNRLPERSQQSTLRALGDKRIRELVDAYVEAWGRGDVDALRELLAEDAVFSMPPWAAWWRGRERREGRRRDLPAGDAHHPDPCQRTAGSRVLPLRRRFGAVQSYGARRVHPRGLADQGNQRVRDAGALPALRSPCRAGARARAA